MTYALFLKHRSLPGRRDELVTVWDEHMLDAIAENDAHEAYVYSEDVADRDVLMVFQQYSSQEAGEAFLQTPEYRAYLAASEPLLAGPPEVTVVRQLWSKNVG